MISPGEFNKVLDNRIRLGIASALMVNETLDFANLKEILDTTDGNLNSHLKSLTDAEYVAVTKQFIGKKPNTSYRLTDLGTKAFLTHLEALERLIKSVKK
ncbi:MAG: transcriptional regulator [Bacteroidota bacterium]